MPRHSPEPGLKRLGRMTGRFGSHRKYGKIDIKKSTLSHLPRLCSVNMEVHYIQISITNTRWVMCVVSQEMNDIPLK